MQIGEFKSIVTTFVDPRTEIQVDGSHLLVSVNGDLIEAQITQKRGDIYVNENSSNDGFDPIPASVWVIDRLAHLGLLASRLRDTIPPTEYFVSPSVSLYPTLENTGSDGNCKRSNDGLKTTLNALDQVSPLETMVLYVTSDAGEGKTSLINQLAWEQATRFLAGQAQWLLVPIPLGGRHFLRFDDITVGVMQNRYRFPFLYYQSFLELVKMGVIVPAFDGFEEMFVESSSGEALSAMGILVGSLESRGAMVVAARKAYYEFENLRTQERLFDTIREYSVGFGKIELHRWTKDQFIQYCNNRGVENPDDIYRLVSERLSSDHALLTRAVLVKRLVDVATKSASLNGFLDQLHKSGTDYFSVFVRALIEREANEKWLDRSNEKEIGTPLLTIDEHCELLSQIALLMWETSVDYLNRENLEFAAEYFCETAKKNTVQARQVRERVRGHAMLIPSSNMSQAVEFDHDEFRLYFLGEGIAHQMRSINARAKAEVFGTFRRGALPSDAMMALFRAITRNEALDRIQLINFLLDIANMDIQASYTRENIADLVIRLISGIDGRNLTIAKLSFGHDALRDKKICKVTFRNCYFASTSLQNAELRNCMFIECEFARLRLAENSTVTCVTFEKCTVDTLVMALNDREIWSPTDIRRQLECAGIIYQDDVQPYDQQLPCSEPDPEIVDLGKLRRYFMRSTHMSESVIRIKLSERGQTFIDRVLPRLLNSGVFVEIGNYGGGHQRRFRLGVTLQAIDELIATSNGSFDEFLQNIH